MLHQGRLDEAEPWLERAERTLRAEVEPAAGMSLRYARAVLELARGRYPEALAAFPGRREAGRGSWPGRTPSVTSMRSRMLQTLVRLGQTGRAEQVLAELGEDERASAEMRTAAAALRLASDDPQAAADALAPVLDGSVSGVRRVRMVTALLLEAGPATRSATGPPPDASWNGRWTSPSPPAYSCRSCWIPPRPCSSGIAGTAPLTPP